MEQNGTDNSVIVMQKLVGFAGGAALFSPLGMPIVHGLAGLAVAGLGVFAAGSLAFKAIGTITGMENPFHPKETIEREELR